VAVVESVLELVTVLESALESVLDSVLDSVSAVWVAVAEAVLAELREPVAVAPLALSSVAVALPNRKSSPFSAAVLAQAITLDGSALYQSG
jgi:hypothetical protein